MKMDGSQVKNGNRRVTMRANGTMIGTGTAKMTDDKRQLIRAFDSCMGEFPNGKGRRNCELLPRSACLAVKLGMDEAAFADAVRGVAPDMGAADVRRAFRTAAGKVQTTGGFGSASGCATYVRNHAGRKDEPPRTFPDHVRNMVHAGRDVRTVEGLMELSPEPVRDETPWCQLMRHLWRLFPDDRQIAFIFRNDPPTPGVPGRSLMRVVDWLHALNPFPPIDAGELVVPNPFTGVQGTTADGKPSFIAQSCLAAFPHMVLEFDEMPIETQCQFWAGFIRNSKVPLVALTYSGGKSIHGCVRIGAADVFTWMERRAKMAALFAADPDASFRADVQAMRPRTGMRLAGVTRASTGKVQRLLWVCRNADARRMAGVPTGGAA